VGAGWRRSDVVDGNGHGITIGLVAAASRATAVRPVNSVAAVVVFHDAEYGVVMLLRSQVRPVQFELNAGDTDIVGSSCRHGNGSGDGRAPEGAVMENRRGVISGLFTVIDIAGDVAWCRRRPAQRPSSM